MENNINDVSINSSFELPRKRFRHSDGFDSTLNSSPAAAEDPNETSDNSFTGTTMVPQSPWETRRLKADLIEARSRVTMLKKEIEHKNTEMATSRLKYEHKITSLERDLAYQVKKVADLEKHMSTLRKREQSSKEELVRTKNQFNMLKQSSGDKMYALERDLNELRQRYTLETADLKSQVRDANTNLVDAREQLATAQLELDIVQKQNDTMQSKADDYDELSKQLEATQEQLATAESRVKTLEYEVGSYEDWKNLSKLSTTRLANCAEMEKENQRLKEDLKNLRGLIGNKLLLEEEVASLKTRLHNFERNEVDTIKLDVKVKDLEAEIGEWREVARYYCHKDSPATAASLRSWVDEIIKRDLVLSSEQTTVKSEKCQIQTAIGEAKEENAALQKQLVEYKRSLKAHQTMLHRVQKKLQLVVGERDCLKQLLESYEKDLTINQTMSSNAQDSQLRVKLEMLEKTLAGYKELCHNLELDVKNSKGIPGNGMDSALTSEQYEALRKTIDELRATNNALTKRKSELEIEVEAHTMRAQLRDPKVLRYVDGIYPETGPIECEKHMAEIEHLRNLVRKLEDGNDELTTRLNQSIVPVDFAEMDRLRKQVKMLETKVPQIRDHCNELIERHRHVCHQLFGYHVDRLDNHKYSVSSDFAPNDFLNFEVDPTTRIVSMLETPYSQKLKDLLTTQLHVHGSIPVLLSMLTLELYNQRSQMDDSFDSSTR